MEAIAWTKAQKDLESFVFRKVKDRDSAKDIVQDVMLKVYTRLGQLKDSEKLSGWAYRIARNAIADHFRAKARTIATEDIEWESDNRELNDCVGRCLHEMLNTLPIKYREAFRISEMDGVSQLELANRLNISYSGAKSRVQRARQMLREKMEKAYLIKLDRYGNVTVCEDRIPCNCPPDKICD